MKKLLILISLALSIGFYSIKSQGKDLGSDGDAPFGKVFEESQPRPEIDRGGESD